MGYEQENAQKITAAFQKLTQRKDLLCVTALTKAFNEAMEYALQIHEAKGWEGHLEHGNDYGWMVVHNGVKVAEGYHEGVEEDGIVRVGLNSLAWVTKHTGWEAILMAGMDKEVARYNWTHEMDVFDAVQGDLVMDIQSKIQQSWNQVKAV